MVKSNSVEMSGDSLRSVFENTPQSTQPTIVEFSIVDSSAVSYIGYTTQYNICEGNVNHFINNQYVYMDVGLLFWKWLCCTWRRRKLVFGVLDQTPMFGVKLPIVPLVWV